MIFPIIYRFIFLYFKSYNNYNSTTAKEYEQTLHHETRREVLQRWERRLGKRLTFQE
jgi:hypothetical protein